MKLTTNQKENIKLAVMTGIVISIIAAIVYGWFTYQMPSSPQLPPGDYQECAIFSETSINGTLYTTSIDNCESSYSSNESPCAGISGCTSIWVGTGTSLSPCYDIPGCTETSVGNDTAGVTTEP